uniref:GMP reductase n=1 Tax=viral metagenome TaxID=1070528 RepID=A0A6C0FBK7_9ZZZZ|tara:strand:+ start:8334 stop:9350 length:1017 start_codon:yes stop_codon:yes gene_type:complete
MFLLQDIKLDFSDVLIKPQNTQLTSRSQVDLERKFKFKHTEQIWKGVPLIASNMDTVGTPEMYHSLKNHKILTCFHKFLKSYPENDRNNYIVSIGIRDEDYKKLEKLYEIYPEKCNIVCVDVANGYMDSLVVFCQRVRELIPHCILIAGNVVTGERTKELIVDGKVDIVKVGIGNGSVCTTRIQTGVGMPQLSALIECGEAAHDVGGYIICDGGITCPGDASKAFGAGSDFVMMGSMLAGHEESGGEIIKEGDKLYKIFYGMSSKEAMNKHYGGVNDYRSSEGKCVKIEYKGPVINTIKNLLGGIRSTCTYVNARSIKDLHNNTIFYRVNNQVNTIYN